MRVVVAGATGFVGVPLCRYLCDAGHQVVALSRSADRARARLDSRVAALEWHPGSDGDPVEAVTGADAVVNLCGESLADGRWTVARKQALLSSRLGPTTALVNAMRAADPGPKVLVNSSAVGYYGDRGDDEVTEDEAAGDDFLAGICRQWEGAAQQAEANGVRVVRLRSGVVLGADGGALSKMTMPVKMFVGGPLGSGRQWFSWIHRHDLVRLTEFCLTRAEASGPINGTAPHPVRNGELMKALGKVLGRPAFMPAPAFALKTLLGEMADMLLTGQKVLPAAAERLGFVFEHPEIEEALLSVLSG